MEKIVQIVQDAGFQHIMTSPTVDYYMIPVSGRLLAFTDEPMLANMVLEKGGVALPRSASIDDIIHSLSADEHDVVDKLI